MSDEQGHPAGCANCAELEKQLDRLFNEDGCPECGYGVTVGCYGCELKAEQERSKALAEQIVRLQDGMEIAWGIIANVCGGDWDHPANLHGWKEAAEKWRDEYWHEMTAALAARAALESK